MELAIIADEFSKAGAYPGIMNQGISMLIPTLLEVGTKAQCQQWIADTLRGDIIWCQGYSEPGSGSDLAAAKTHARVEDGHFVVNGQKIWTSSAHYSDMMFLLCRTEPDAPKHAGLSYLLLSMKTPGIEVRPLVTMTGRATFNETFFTDVRVPVDQIVMGRGDGWHVANVTLKYERMLLGNANKICDRFQRVREIMERNDIDGVRIIDIPAYRDRLLRLQGEALASKYHGMRLLTEQAKGEDSGLKRMIVKLNGTMVLFRLSALAVDALGAAGLALRPQRRVGGGRRRGDAVVDRLHVRHRPDHRRRLVQHPKEHHRRAGAWIAARAQDGACRGWESVNHGIRIVRRAENARRKPHRLSQVPRAPRYGSQDRGGWNRV